MLLLLLTGSIFYRLGVTFSNVFATEFSMYHSGAFKIPFFERHVIELCSNKLIKHKLNHGSHTTVFKDFVLFFFFLLFFASAPSGQAPT